MNYSKDGITVAPMLDTAHPKKSGKCPVKIRVTYKRIRWYYPTGKDMTAEEWAALPTTKARIFVAVRKDIESSYQIVRSAVEELATSGGFSLEALNNRLKNAATDTVNTAFRARMEALSKALRVGNTLIYDNVLKGLERFAGPRIHFESITVLWLEKYVFISTQRREGADNYRNPPTNPAGDPQHSQAARNYPRGAISIWPGPRKIPHTSWNRSENGPHA